MTLHPFHREIRPIMRHQTDDEHAMPVITVPEDVYNAILLADGVMVVAKGAGIPDHASRTGATLPSFFAIRRCVLTAGQGAAQLNRLPGPNARPSAVLMKCMVGG